MEIKPELKRRLYGALALSGSTLKDWFVQSAEQFCGEALQRDLFETKGPASRKDAPRT